MLCLKKVKLSNQALKLQSTTFPKLITYKIIKDKPLIVCDADEVIFDFMYSFEKYLHAKSLYFNWKSYALEGNILNDKNEALNRSQITDTINSFFMNKTESMSLVEGAVNSLQILSKKHNIIILSNIPFKFYEKRKVALKKCGINFPFFANTGPKGKAVKYLSDIHKGKIWFIDDSPFQIKSVKLEEKNVNTILFVGNSKLEALIKNKNEYCDHFSNKWEDNIKTILN
jgi:hypothetical protein